MFYIICKAAAGDRPAAGEGKMIVYWKLATGTVLTSIFGPVAEEALSRDHDTVIVNRIVCRQQNLPPHDCVQFRLGALEPWRPVEEWREEMKGAS
jgi:hypothetical protein